MSIKGVIYDLLANNQELKARLANSFIAGAEGSPAIYDRWPANDAEMPYIVHSWRFPPGDTWGQVSAQLQLDIFTSNGDTLEAEEIKEICVRALAWEKMITPNEGHISIYLGGFDEELPEPEPEIVHWQVDFLVKYWRQQLIAAVTQ